MRTNIIITGIPGSGKSTILKKVISEYKNKVGFVTNEVRENGKRIGFEIETHSGEKSFLAHVDFKSDLKVSKYYVDINNLNDMITKVTEFNSDDLLFLDEIGQMELFSEKFKDLTTNYLDSPNTCISTLSKVYSEDFTEKIKNRKDIILIEITVENRGEKYKYIEALIKKIGKAERYAKEQDRFTIKNNEAIVRTDHGIKNLIFQNNEWTCNCDFFQAHNICSHIIALEEFLKN